MVPHEANDDQSQEDQWNQEDEITHDHDDHREDQWNQDDEITHDHDDHREQVEETEQNLEEEQPATTDTTDGSSLEESDQVRKFIFYIIKV